MWDALEFMLYDFTMYSFLTGTHFLPFSGADKKACLGGKLLISNSSFPAVSQDPFVITARYCWSRMVGLPVSR